MGRRTLVACFAIASVVVIACNAVTGIGDLVVEKALGDASVIDVAVPDATPPPPIDDSGADADAAPVDAGPPPLCPSDAHSCVPVPPDGWDGPFLMYDGDRGSAPGCPTEMPTTDDENVGTPTGTISCSGCQCGAPQGQTCGAGASEYTDPTCADGTYVQDVDISSCQTIPDGGVYIYTYVNAGTCTPSVVNTQPSDIDWPNVARLCSRDDGFAANGCGDGQLCVPDGPQPFGTHTCIRKAHSDEDCPAPWTQKETTYNNVDDTRACSASSCFCAKSQGATCTLTARGYGSANCSGTPSSIPIPDPNCVPATQPGSLRAFVGGGVITGGSCAPHGNPSATGSVAGGDDVNTICCEP